MREAALPALVPSLTRSSSSALTRSPSASVSAFLHSIIGASVLARSSATSFAVITAILILRFQFDSLQVLRLKKGGYQSPASSSRQVALPDLRQPTLALPQIRPSLQQPRP